MAINVNTTLVDIPFLKRMLFQVEIAHHSNISLMTLQL